jgi:hypothetical protein
MIRRRILAIAILALPLAFIGVAQAQLPVRPAASQAATAKPNIVVIADNTIVVFASDNGAETFTRPDGGTIFPFGNK